MTCFILAPVLAGLLFDFISEEFTAVFLAAWNLVSVIIEYLLLVLIYKQYPELAKRSTEESNTDSDSEDSNISIKNRIKMSWQSWKLYMRHPARNAGLALACLYMTVLGFDNITYGYCLHQCVSESILGGLVGISSAIGMLGSISFPFLRKRFNVQRTGLIGFVLLCITLSPCVVSIWLPGSPFMLYQGKNETALEIAEVNRQILLLIKFDNFNNKNIFRISQVMIVMWIVLFPSPFSSPESSQPVLDFGFRI